MVQSPRFQPMIACVALLTLALPAAAQAPISGTVYVLDGDTISLRTADGEQRIRLQGIDACEMEQNAYRAGELWPCGEESRNWLVTLTEGKQVSCISQGRDRYNRILATCTVDGKDIGASALGAGMAIHAYTDDPHYAALELQAKEAKAGMWAYSFDAPSVWRRNNPSTPRR